MDTYTLHKMQVSIHLLMRNSVVYSSYSKEWKSHSTNEVKNTGSGNRTSTQCLQNRTEQLVVNGIFQCVSELVLPDLPIKSELHLPTLLTFY